LAEGWPDVASRVIGMAEDATADRDLPVEINDAWREAFADAAALAKVDNELRVTPDALIVRAAHTQHRIEFETGVTKETTWTIPFLKPMIAVATFWDPDRDGPGVFVGPDLVGLVARSSGR
ncbi:MAG: hypothetical protein KGJ13_12495, partial [Patescibacteria group bacterium]|nr:hypothetical protein [Patescibacteria group bacterium]